MRNKLTIPLLVVLIVLLACSFTKPKSEKSSPSDMEQMDALEYSFDDTSVFEADLQPDEIGSISDFPLTDIYHLEVVLADDLLSLSGRLQVRYFNRMDGDLAEVYFRLLPNLWGNLMQVSSVSVNGSPVTPRLENGDTALYVPLTEKVPSGGYVDIDLQFSDILPQDGSGNYGTFGFQDETLALAQFYPLIPLRDEDGWRIELYPPDGDVTVTEVANYLVKLSAPKDLIMACSGVQLKREIEADRQVVLQATALSREFYLAASTEYKKQSLSEDGITYTVYSHPEVARGAQKSLEFMTEAVTIFNNRYGAYPYNELELAATPTSAGGVEYPGVFAINQVLFDPNGVWGSMNARDAVESVVVHEVAHEWFYNMVGNDQGREPWLDEAVAQYMTYQYFYDYYGPLAGSSFMDSWYARWNRVEQEPIPIGMPVENYEGLEYGAIVYGRGPIFLHELSGEMGLSAFNQFMKDYFTSYTWKVATSQDFQSLAEKSCGCDLDSLFSDWVYFE